MKLRSDITALEPVAYIGYAVVDKLAARHSELRCDVQRTDVLSGDVRNDAWQTHRVKRVAHERTRSFARYSTPPGSPYKPPADLDVLRTFSTVRN